MHSDIRTQNGFTHTRTFIHAHQHAQFRTKYFACIQTVLHYTQYPHSLSLSKFSPRAIIWVHGGLLWIHIVTVVMNEPSKINIRTGMYVGVGRIEQRFRFSTTNQTCIRILWFLSVHNYYHHHHPAHTFIYISLPLPRFLSLPPLLCPFSSSSQYCYCRQRTPIRSNSLFRVPKYSHTLTQRFMQTQSWTVVDTSIDCCMTKSDWCLTVWYNSVGKNFIYFFFF